MAPLLLSYGKALYELAFSQQGVMGREEIEKEVSGSGVLFFSTLPPSLPPHLTASLSLLSATQGRARVVRKVTSRS